MSDNERQVGWHVRPGHQMLQVVYLWPDQELVLATAANRVHAESQMRSLKKKYGEHGEFFPAMFAERLARARRDG